MGGRIKHSELHPEKGAVREDGMVYWGLAKGYNIPIWLSRSEYDARLVDRRRNWNEWHRNKLLADPDFRKRHNERGRAWREKHRDRVKGFSLKYWYGISQEEYTAMHNAQGGVCAICSRPETSVNHGKGGGIKWLAVDHCHETGVIRGLLCHFCNTGIGKLQDSPATLRKAANYIECHAIKSGRKSA